MSFPLFLFNFYVFIVHFLIISITISMTLSVIISPLVKHCDLWGAERMAVDLDRSFAQVSDLKPQKLSPDVSHLGNKRSVRREIVDWETFRLASWPLKVREGVEGGTYLVTHGLRAHGLFGWRAFAPRTLIFIEIRQSFWRRWIIFKTLSVSLLGC